MKKIFFFIGLLGSCCGKLSLGQEFIHCDPYKMTNHPYLHFANDAEFISTSNVRKIEKVRHPMGKNGQPKEKGETQRTIEFNRIGQPVKLIQTTDLYEVRGKIPKSVEYNFEYTDDQKYFKKVVKKVVLKKEEVVETTTSFSYDDKRRLVKEDNVQKRITEGRTISSNKSAFALFYNHAGTISTLTEMVIYPSDTVEKYHHYAKGFSLDSLFRYRPPVEEKKDYKGTIVEKIVYQDEVIVEGGGHIKEKRIKYKLKYHYNKNKLIDRIQKFNAKNRLIEVSYFNYLENNLISESKIDNKEYSNAYVLRYNYLYY